jgi:hypothetical protein
MTTSRLRLRSIPAWTATRVAAAGEPDEPSPIPAVTPGRRSRILRYEYIGRRVKGHLAELEPSCLGVAPPTWNFAF